MDASIEKYLEFELGLLDFNHRVLMEASDPRTPLLERAKFASIFSSNLDEFFMKRVGGLKRQVLADVVPRGMRPIRPQDKLVKIRTEVQTLLAEESEILSAHIFPELKERGVRLLDWSELSPAEVEFVRHFYVENIFPVLTPLSVDPGHPFPFISGLSTSIGVILRPPVRGADELFARVKIPNVFPAWVPTGEPGAELRLVSLHDIVSQNLSSLFPGLDIVDVMAFRVVRNADVEQDEDADDLLEMVSEEIRERRFAEVVRLDHGPKPSPRILKILTDELGVSQADVFEMKLPLQYYALHAVSELPLPELKYPSWVPAVPSILADRDSNLFDVIRETDILVHHPYESFTASVERFVRTAADDPKVIAIKMTIYRTGDDSPFIPLLIRAAEAGKQVVCLVELKARFDEARNIVVAQQLENAGVHVVYGIVGLKTHSKVALVVRKEKDGVRSYCHVGTGNYHSRTAQLYTDLGLFTAKREICEDVVHLFHYLTGRSLHWHFKKLLVAPIDMKTSFLRMVKREEENARTGRPAHILAKMNALEDVEVIDALYAASQAGVRIDLIVRGVSCLRAQVPGLSENIRVVSVIGRFLEHSRVFYFRNGATESVDGDFFIGSADWMSRNLNNRVEACVPVEAPGLKTRCWDILNILLNDQRQAWELQVDGRYVQRSLNGQEPGKNPLGSHDILMNSTPGRRVRRPSRSGRVRRPARPRPGDSAMVQ